MATNADDAAMLLRIGQLSGQINRVKNGQLADQTPTYSAASPYNNRGSMSSFDATNKSATDSNQNYSPAWGQTRGRGRGGYYRGYGRSGRPGPVYRNPKLVLNGATPNSALLAENQRPTDGGTDSPGGPGFIAKTGRHLQLINSTIYEKDVQKRAKDMEKTRMLKLKLRDEREKSKINRHLQRLGDGDEVEIQGVKFQVTKNGNKLSKVLDVANSAKPTPRVATLAKVLFQRSKNGNMYRAAVVSDHRRTAVVKKITEPCREFSTNGACSNRKCRYVHDPTKVAACKDFLLKGSCPSGASCDLSHDLTPERTIPCDYFNRGNCNKADCRYLHVRFSPSAPVCRSFGIYGYCEKGASCVERHTHNECPNFSNTGKCAIKGCKLAHVLKAHVLRNTGDEEEGSDISSDEDEEAHDSDVDSDDLEKFFGDDGFVDTDVAEQKDYMQFA